MVSVTPHDAYGNKSAAAELDIGRDTQLKGPKGIWIPDFIHKVAEGADKMADYLPQLHVFKHITAQLRD